MRIAVTWMANSDSRMISHWSHSTKDKQWKERKAKRLNHNKVPPQANYRATISTALDYAFERFYRSSLSKSDSVNQSSGA